MCHTVQAWPPSGWREYGKFRELHRLQVTDWEYTQLEGDDWNAASNTWEWAIHGLCSSLCMRCRKWADFYTQDYFSCSASCKDLTYTLPWMCPNTTRSAVEALKPALPNDASHWHSTITRLRASTPVKTGTDFIHRRGKYRNEVRGDQRPLHHLNCHCGTAVTHWLMKDVIKLSAGKLITPQTQPRKPLLDWGDISEKQRDRNNTAKPTHDKSNTIQIGD